MTDEEINELLLRILSQYTFTRSSEKAVKWSVKKQRIFRAERMVAGITGDTFAKAREALAACGAVLTENVEEKVLEGVILAGVCDMNPAYVRILAEEGILRLQAAAKEGLVKQHTAERAIERLEKALDD